MALQAEMRSSSKLGSFFSVQVCHGPAVPQKDYLCQKFLEDDQLFQVLLAHRLSEELEELGLQDSQLSLLPRRYDHLTPPNQF